MIEEFLVLFSLNIDAIWQRLIGAAVNLIEAKRHTFLEA